MNEGIHLDLDTWIVPGQISSSSSSKVGRPAEVGFQGFPGPRAMSCNPWTLFAPHCVRRLSLFVPN